MPLLLSGLWWTKKSKGKNKIKKKEGEKAPPKSMKGGHKPKGDILQNKSEGPLAKSLGATHKNGDVGSSLSPVGRPSNQQKRTIETIRSIADGS